MRVFFTLKGDEVFLNILLNYKTRSKEIKDRLFVIKYEIKYLLAVYLHEYVLAVIL